MRLHYCRLNRLLPGSWDPHTSRLLVSLFLVVVRLPLIVWQRHVLPLPLLLPLQLLTLLLLLARAVGWAPILRASALMGFELLLHLLLALLPQSRASRRTAALVTQPSATPALCLPP